MTRPAPRRRGLIGRLRDEAQNHRHFHVALAIGALVWAATTGRHPALRVLLAADVFFASYIALMLRLALSLDPAALARRGRSRARTGMGLVASLTFFAMVISLWAIFLLLNHGGDDEGRWFPALAVASVPLSWAMTHTLAAYHYATLYYRPGPSGAPEGGLAFSGGDPPDGLDFLYQAFVIGASLSVSDVPAASRAMRRAVMVHSLAAFAFNTVLIAVAVNAAIILAGRAGGG